VSFNMLDRGTITPHYPKGDATVPLAASDLCRLPIPHIEQRTLPAPKLAPQKSHVSWPIVGNLPKVAASNLVMSSGPSIALSTSPFCNRMIKGDTFAR
jgi:hypothetical protein